MLLSRYLKRVLLIVDHRTLLVTMLSVFGTYLCLHYKWVANFPLTLIATAIVFPIVFSIGSAYKRRETALQNYGEIKANGYSIYLATRDWLVPAQPQSQEKVRVLLHETMDHIRHMLIEPVESLRSNEIAIYRQFSLLSAFVRDDLRAHELSPTEISRCSQYVTKMLTSFESIKHIYQYRTPRSLRAFSDVFIYALPLLYGPYFAFEALKYSHGLEYVMPVLFSLVLVSLNNIQRQLENPFDQVGVDDIDISVERFMVRLS